MEVIPTIMWVGYMVYRTWKVPRPLRVRLSHTKFTVLQLALFACLIFVSGVYSPLGLVVSGSMEPSLYRGDMFFMYNHHTPDIGDIAIFNHPDGTHPIIHRIIGKKYGKWITKGDANSVPDTFLFPRGVNPAHIKGLMYLRVPYVGLAFIHLVEHTYLKYAIALWELALTLVNG
jgi:signal peptidase I